MSILFIFMVLYAIFVVISVISLVIPVISVISVNRHTDLTLSIYKVTLLMPAFFFLGGGGVISFRSITISAHDLIDHFHVFCWPGAIQ